IDYSTGEAVHTHGGAAIDLGTTGCPAVYKFAYLEDQTHPVFGRETAPNPLAWQIQVSDATGIDSMDSAYRVRDAAGHILYDWTSIQPDSSGVYSVALYRNRIAALGTQTGHMFIDVRFRDMFGNESTTSECWDNHPMAPPLKIGALTRGELFGWTLTANSPLSHVMKAAGADVLTQDFTQYAAEPVTIQISLPTFSIPFTLAAVDDYYAAAPVDASYPCARSMANCDTTAPADPADRSTSGTLSSSDWFVWIQDSAGTSTLCSAIGPSATCTVPARTATQSPLAYHLRIRMANAWGLQPFPEAAFDPSYYDEFSLGGLTYTGLAPVATTKCSQYVNNGDGTVTCTQTVTYSELKAADRITLQFPAIAESFKSAVNATATLENVTTAAGLSLPAVTWDSGNDDLPGPQ
ncbi:MAG: hypothetical protein JO257_11070, partial [Deltaproteobacteria bacterium]|nr:hypothetical protein [Deltaproteobacteria bacterium]